MIVTFFSVLMAVFWSSILIPVFYILRKSGLLTYACSMTGMIVLYLFCAVRALIPVEIRGAQAIGVPLVYNPLYRAAKHEVFPGMGIKVYHVFYMLWFVGAVAALIRFFIKYRRVMDYFSKLPDVSDQKILAVCDGIFEEGKRPDIKISSAVGTPCCVGIKREMIILPHKNYTDEQLKFIIRHEAAHIKNRDALLKFLTNVFCAVYWWNPVILLLKKDLNQSMEIRCDEMVVGGRGKPFRSSYLSVILEEFENSTVSDHKNDKFIMSFFEEKSDNMVERFTLVSEEKRNTGRLFPAVVIAICLFVSSYTFIFQSAYGPPLEDILPNETATVVSMEYIIRHPDGSYSVRCNNGKILPLEPEVAECAISVDVPVIDE